MSLAITQVDAFADRPFAGNPAAVCILEQPREDAWMQKVAREMNLSETAFLVKREARLRSALVHAHGGSRPVRPRDTRERSRALGARPSRPERAASFHTKSGVLTAEKEGTWIEMNFPATPAEPEPGPHEKIWSRRWV